jgi:hypothetical protein
MNECTGWGSMCSLGSYAFSCRCEECEATGTHLAIHRRCGGNFLVGASPVRRYGYLHLANALPGGRCNGNLAHEEGGAIGVNVHA